MRTTDYWAECIAQSAEECGLKISAEQLDVLARAVEISHENYGMAFYSPPSSERLNEIEDEWKKKVKDLEAQMERYRDNATTAVKTALKLRDDTNISIGEHGEVFLHGGRWAQIQ